MAEEIGHAYVAILPSAKDFTRAMERQITPGLNHLGSSSGHRFGTLYTKSALGPLRVLGAAAAGIFAVDKVAGFFKSSIAEARESQIVTAKTNAVIKSTGGVANVSAKQVGNLATAISNKVGIDDEAIQSSENLLLTFKNVRNEAGKGNDIFNQATQTVTDMSAALGQDAKSSAIQLGKALNDPVKGITALSRVGVTFDAGQVKQIKTLVAHGKALTAQKIILKELSSEFGGAAAASTTTGQKVSVAFKNIEESVGRALLPALDTLERTILTRVFPAFRTAATYFKTSVVPILANFGQFVSSSIIPAVSRFVGQVGPALISAARTTFGFFTTNVLPVLQGVWRFVAQKVVPAVGSLFVSALGDLKAAFHTVSGAIDAHRAQLSELFNGAKKVAGFVLRVLVPVFRADLKTTFQTVGIAFTVLIDLISAGVKVFNGLRRAVTAVGHFFAGPFLRVMGSLVQVVVKSFQFMADAALGFVETFTHSASKAFGWVPLVGGKLKAADKAVTNFRSGVDSTLSGMAASASKWGRHIGTNIDNGIIGGLTSKQKEVYSAARGIGTAALTGTGSRLKIQSPSKVFHYFGQMTVQGFINGIRDGRIGLHRALTVMGDSVTNFANTIKVKSVAAEFLHTWTATLTDLGKRLDTVQSKMSNLRSARADLSSSIAGNLISGASLSNAPSQNLTAALSFKRIQARQIKTFRRDLGILAKRGVSQKEINDLAQQGLAALPFVEQLTTASNGQIRDLNHLDRVINSNSKALGAKVAGETYNPQLATLASKLDHLTTVVAGDGRRLVDAERKIRRNHQTKTKNRTSNR